jgi:hypothetical protein
MGLPITPRPMKPMIGLVITNAPFFDIIGEINQPPSPRPPERTSPPVSHRVALPRTADDLLPGRLPLADP